MVVVGAVGIDHRPGVRAVRRRDGVSVPRRNAGDADVDVTRLSLHVRREIRAYRPGGQRRGVDTIGHLADAGSQHHLDLVACAAALRGRADAHIFGAGAHIERHRAGLQVVYLRPVGAVGGGVNIDRECVAALALRLIGPDGDGGIVLDVAQRPRRGDRRAVGIWVCCRAVAGMHDVGFYAGAKSAI